MSKHTLTRKITKELDKLNDRIDQKIIKGRPYQSEAQRHRALLATMRHLMEEDRDVSTQETSYRAKRVGLSPVRRTLQGSSFLRVFGFSAV